MNSNPVSGNSGIRVSPAMIGCFVLVGAFFLPWINFLGMNVPGYQISKLSSNWQWLWLIPIMSAIALILGFAGKRHIEFAQIAGGLPFIGLAIVLYQNGKDVFQLFLVGAWATLIVGAFLLSIAPRLGRKSAAQAPRSTVAAGEDNR